LANPLAVAQDPCVVRPRLDAIDRRLLATLQRDADRPLRDLGVEVGLSESAVHRRLGRLRRSGVLARVVALLDPRRLTPVMTSIVLVALDRDSATAHAAFRERMHAEGRVQQCYSIVGQWDYVVVLVTGGLTESRALSQQLFMATPDIRRYETLPVAEAVKVGLELPLL
jgi:Lrp/AsnC family leucine-responsive transcriptional regulator